MAATQVGAPVGNYREYVVLNANVSTLPVTAAAVADGSWCHIVDTGVFGRFFANGGATGHWYDSASGAVIV